MSLEAYVWAANLPLTACSAAGYRVLLMLADRADPLGYSAWPSVATMARTLECSTRTIQRALREIEDAGLIRQGDQRQVAHLRRDQRPVVYDVLTTALIVTERIDKRGDSSVTPLRERGDSSVTPLRERGDRNSRDGVTTVVTQTVLNPLTKTSPRILTLVTARESGDDK